MCIRDRLRTNIALRVEQTESKDVFLVAGRGELHLGILIETMRREGYEFQVSRPEAIVVIGEDGIKYEPFEEVHVDVDPEYVGAVVEMLGERRGRMTNMTNNPENTVHHIYTMHTRGLLGFRYKFLTVTRGRGVLNISPDIVAVARTSIGPVPMLVIIMVTLYAFFHWLLTRTRFGRYIYYVGYSRDAA